MFQDPAAPVLWPTLPLSPGIAFLLDQILGQVRVTGKFQDMKKSLHLFICFNLRVLSHVNMYFCLNWGMLIHMPKCVYLYTSISLLPMQKQTSSQLFVPLNHNFSFESPGSNEARWNSPSAYGGSEADPFPPLIHWVWG